MEQLLCIWNTTNRSLVTLDLVDTLQRPRIVFNDAVLDAWNVSRVAFSTDKMFQRKIFAWNIYEKVYTRENFFIIFRTVVKIMSLGLQCGRYLIYSHLSRRARESRLKEWTQQETTFFTVTKNSVSEKMIRCFGTKCHRIALPSPGELRKLENRRRSGEQWLSKNFIDICAILWREDRGENWKVAITLCARS